MLTILSTGNRTRHVFFFLAVCLLLFGEACKKDHSSSHVPSSLSFTYSGDTTGSFSAVGDYLQPPPDNGEFSYEWAKAERTEHVIDLFHKEDWINIVANVPTPLGNITFSTPRKTGTYLLVNGWINAEIYLNGQVFTFTSGAINVTYYKNERIRGTFNGTATYYGSPNKEIQVINGQFDIKVN